MTDDEEFLQHMDTQPLTFGKHKGETPEQVAKHSPGYIRWMYENINPKVCSAKLNLAVDEAVQKEAIRYARRQGPRTRIFGGSGREYTGPDKGGYSGGFDDMDDDIPF